MNSHNNFRTITHHTIVDNDSVVTKEQPSDSQNSLDEIHIQNMNPSFAPSYPTELQNYDDLEEDPMIVIRHFLHDELNNNPMAMQSNMVQQLQPSEIPHPQIPALEIQQPMAGQEEEYMEVQLQQSFFSPGKLRLRWTQELHNRFLRAGEELGGLHNATAKGILEKMKVRGITIYHVKSHLQKFRLRYENVQNQVNPPNNPPHQEEPAGAQVNAI